MKISTALLTVVIALVAAACGSEISESVTSTASQPAAEASVINWQTLGCDEPAPLVVESSEALETDVGLAADSLAATSGVSIEEAKRRLRLQEVMGQAMASVQAAEAGRVARSEFQYAPTYAAVVTLTGTGAISERTREILCSTPELEVRFGARFTQDELVNEATRLSPLIFPSNPGLTSWGPGDGELRFDVIDDASRDQLDAVLSTLTEYPYSISSLGLPPFVLDPNVPFPLQDITGRATADVGMSGTLLIEEPCVYLNDTLLILPARETTWDRATGVLNTGSGDLRSGDSVTGGGSQYRGSLADLTQPPDPSCRLGGGAFVASFAPVDPNATPAPVPPSAGFDGSQASSGAPPEPPDAPLFRLDPLNPRAGEMFTATFDEDNQRGGFFDLRRWQDTDWTPQRFVLESAAIRPASAIEVNGTGEGLLMEDYGVGGSGPDQLILPADIEPGRWRLCTANAGTQVCTQFTIDG